MIEVKVAELAEVEAEAVMRPVACDFSPVNPAMRRFDEAAGPAVAEQCARLGDLPLGSAAITAGGGIAARFIVHVAVRSADENTGPAVIRRGVVNGLRRLQEWEIASAALAPLGASAGNLDAEEAAELMVPLLADHVRGGAPPGAVILVVEDEYQRSVFAAALARHAEELAGTGP